MMKSKYPWDYTYLYVNIYKSLVEMSPYIIGIKSTSRHSKRYKRDFLEATELARRISLGLYDNLLLMPGSNDKIDQETYFIGRLTELLRLNSQRWWD